MQALPASRSVLLILHSNRAAISTPWQFEKLAAHAYIEYAGDRSGDSQCDGFCICTLSVNGKLYKKRRPDMFFHRAIHFMCFVPEWKSKQKQQRVDCYCNSQPTTVNCFVSWYSLKGSRNDRVAVKA